MAPITGFKETKTLIEAVRERPALYNPKSAQYADKEAKTLIWKEVFVILTPNWDEMSRHARDKRGKDIQRRWKSIRDAYVKELRMLKEQGAACYKTAGLKRKPYIYFENLSFLRPLIDHRISLKQCEMDAEENNGIVPFPFATAFTEESYVEDESVDCADHHMSIKGDANEITTYPDIVTTSAEEEADPDRMFLLSLVPSLKQLNEMDKSAVKIQIMQTIHKALYEQDTESV